MKKLMLICLSLTLLFSQAIAKEFKCYVELQDKDPQIALVKVKENETSDHAKQFLKINGIFAADGKQKLRVIKVSECVLVDTKFSSRQARALEALLPF